MSWTHWVEARNDQTRRAGQWRAPRDFDAAGPEGTLAGQGGAVVSFASNDYLGLTQHPDVRAAAIGAIERWGTGAGSARLIVGSRPVHHDLEAALASWRQMPAAALFPTGFAANLGVLSALGDASVLICSDELNHASIIDGCRMARAEVAVYRHADIAHLATLVHDRAAGRRVLVVSDTVFSMDGDEAPVDELRTFCAAHDALLVLDEAHAVLGPEIPNPDDGIVRLGTLSKTLGSLGGFVAASRAVVDLVVNRARSYIFTTAPTPADSAAALAAVAIVTGAEGAARRAQLRAAVERLRPGHPSPIVPVLCGPEARAVEAAAALLARGLLVPAIRPPTVAPGSSRLRITLSAAHTDEQIDRLVDALAEEGLA